MNPQLQLMLQQAIQAFENGNFDSADSMLKRLLQVDSKNLPALHVLGLIKAAQGRYQESADYLGRAARLNPNDASIQYNLAKALMDCGDDKGATPHHKKAVELYPKNPQAWLNYGKSTFNLGRHDEALAHYDRALQLKSDYYDAWMSKSLALYTLERYTESLEHCDKALFLGPSSHEAYNNKGIILHALNRFDEALKCYAEALKLQSDYYEAHSNKGVTLHSLKQYEEALVHYDRAISLKPDYFEAWTNRGLTFHELKRYDDALLNYDKALSLNPASIKCWLNRGLSLHQLERYEEALIHYDRAISLKPDYFEAWTNRGLTFHELKRYDDALVNYEQALRIKPNYGDAWLSKASTFYKLAEYENALANCQRAISIKPDNHLAHNNKGLILTALNQHEEALKNFNEAIRLQPDYYLSFRNRGFALHGLNRNKEALLSYDLALAIKSNDQDTLWNKSLALLVEGDLENGFPLYENRLYSKQIGKIANGARIYEAPKWTGKESLAGKTIFLYGEQGFGDCIQFSRYAKLVANLGATVLLEVPQALVPIMNNLTGVSRVISMGEELPSFDFHSAIMSLPAIFKTNLSNIPCANQYINIDHHPNKIIEWKDRLGAKTKPRIGLAWSGNLIHSNDSNRSLLLNTILPYLPAGFNYVSLQKEVRPEDKLALEANPNILNFSEFLNDFLDTAALIHQLDLVISVDTSVAHLSAALGKKTWILIPFAPDWRWLLDREDSPWYSSVKLYRQTSIGNWASPLIKMKADLEKIKSTL